MTTRSVLAALAFSGLLAMAAGAHTAGPLPAEISVAEAHAGLASGGVILIDVRTPEEWTETGLAQGAKRATLQDEDFIAQIETIARGQKDAPIAFICRSGRRSAEARDKLQAAGFTNVTSVAGGMLGETGWISAELPMTASPAPDCPVGATATC